MQWTVQTVSICTDDRFPFKRKTQKKVKRLLKDERNKFCKYLTNVFNKKSEKNENWFENVMATDTLTSVFSSVHWSQWWIITFNGKHFLRKVGICRYVMYVLLVVTDLYLNSNIKIKIEATSFGCTTCTSEMARHFNAIRCDAFSSFFKRF